MRSVAGDRKDDRLAVVTRCTVRLPFHRLVRHIDLHRLHGAQAGFSRAPANAVVGVPSGLAIRLQQAKLGSGRSRCGELQIATDHPGQRGRIPKVSVSQTHLGTLSGIGSGEDHTERIAGIGELENIALSQLGRAVAPCLGQRALGPLAGLGVQDGNGGVFRRVLKQRGDGRVAGKCQRHMVERLARRDVEVDVADIILRMTGDAPRRQLVRHEDPHHLFRDLARVRQRDANDPVFVLVTAKLLPTNTVDRGMDVAVRIRLAGEYECEPALVVERRLAQVRHDVVSAEVRGDRLVRVHRHRKRRVAARLVAAPVHPRVAGCRRRVQCHF